MNGLIVLAGMIVGAAAVMAANVWAARRRERRAARRIAEYERLCRRAHGPAVEVYGPRGEMRRVPVVMDPGITHLTSAQVELLQGSAVGRAYLRDHRIAIHDDPS
jgi:hypothetical protein